MIDFAKVKDYKVLLVGDGIVDEYHYVHPLGKSIKEHTISVMMENKETFNGGVWAAAQHVKGFCKTVDVQTGPTSMANIRFVDKDYTRKLFTVHERRTGAEIFDAKIRDYDLVIVTDFGHGALNKPLIERLTRDAKYLCVNAQTNSQNYGFNLITKYPRADYVVIDELEARLAAHDKDGPIEDVIDKLGFHKIVVTCGARGAIGFHEGTFERQPALTEKVLDSMGAGDAFLAISAPFAAAGLPMKELVRIGNAAGAAKTGIIGHRKAVDRHMLEEYLG